MFYVYGSKSRGQEKRLEGISELRHDIPHGQAPRAGDCGPCQTPRVVLSANPSAHCSARSRHHQPPHHLLQGGRRWQEEGFRCHRHTGNGDGGGFLSPLRCNKPVRLHSVTPPLRHQSTLLLHALEGAGKLSLQVCQCSASAFHARRSRSWQHRMCASAGCGMCHGEKGLRLTTAVPGLGPSGSMRE